MFVRAAGVVGLVALGLACGGGGPAESPFYLWSIRPGMPLTAVADYLIVREGLTPDAVVWGKGCANLDGGARRCEHQTTAPVGQIVVVVASDHHVLYVSFAPATRDPAFDDSLSLMQRQWARVPGVRMDPHGVSEQHPTGVAEMRNGRWRAFMTFDGKVCTGTQRPCPALIQLVDWHDGRKYVDMSVPR